MGPEREEGICARVCAASIMCSFVSEALETSDDFAGVMTGVTECVEAEVPGRPVDVLAPKVQEVSVGVSE